MKITLIYDNEVYQKEKDLTADWGFSCLVEVKNQPKILFDTGAKGGILLDNMEKLGIDPKSIDEVFISHDHWDHVDGLADFLGVSGDVTIYCPASYQPPKAMNIVRIKEPAQIHERIFSTGELKGEGNELEQSLIVETDKGLVVICGCSHPGVGRILQAASGHVSGNGPKNIYALIGGLHGFKEFNLLGDLELICPCHCTRFKTEIESMYPEKCIGGGCGRVIEI